VRKENPERFCFALIVILWYGMNVVHFGVNEQQKIRYGFSFQPNEIRRWKRE
jgi:hypothetical protein